MFPTVAFFHLTGLIQLTEAVATLSDFTSPTLPLGHQADHKAGFQRRKKKPRSERMH